MALTVMMSSYWATPFLPAKRASMSMTKAGTEKRTGTARTKRNFVAIFGVAEFEFRLVERWVD
jgi:hypothetical protein